MEQYIIKGGHPLVGEVEIGGAKNAALAILAAAIMTDETDVFKRQDYDDFIRRNPNAKIYMATTKATKAYTDVEYGPDCYIMSVSYTHLDVYKRQEQQGVPIFVQLLPVFRGQASAVQGCRAGGEGTAVFYRPGGAPGKVCGPYL